MISRQAIRLLFSRQYSTRALGTTASSTTITITSSSSSSSIWSSLHVNNHQGAHTFPSHPRWFSSKVDVDSEKKPAEDGEAVAATEEADTVDDETTTDAILSEDEQRLATLDVEVKTLKDQLLRSLAEAENTRTIAKRDITEARQFAIKSFAKSLLDVSDNLHRALESIPDEDVDTHPQLKSLYEGIEMTNSGLFKALASNGVQPFCQVPGDKFDPERHNALMQYPDASLDSETVGQVIKSGFTLNDRVLRPAEVGVVKNV